MLYQEPVVKGFPNRRMPFASEQIRVDHSAPLLDMVYIPTREDRPVPETGLDLLLEHSERVTVLCSQGAPDWAQTRRSGLIVLENVEDYFDMYSYRNILCNQNSSMDILPTFDIPAKRTFAIREAHELGYRSVALIDDDITLSNLHLHRARSALRSGVDVAAFHVLDHPDVSTVDHIERMLTNMPSPVSIGGNCLFMRPDTQNSLFPSIYNDDWFFLLASVSKSRIKSIGTATQRNYSPWQQNLRIEFEQLGDIIIEGAKSSIAHGYAPFANSELSWRKIVDVYLERLERLISICSHVVLKDALSRAQRTALSISTDEIIEFLNNFTSEIERN